MIRDLLSFSPKKTRHQKETKAYRKKKKHIYDIYRKKLIGWRGPGNRNPLDYKQINNHHGLFWNPCKFWGGWSKGALGVIDRPFWESDLQGVRSYNTLGTTTVQSRDLCVHARIHGSVDWTEILEIEGRVALTYHIPLQRNIIASV